MPSPQYVAKHGLIFHSIRHYLMRFYHLKASYALLLLFSYGFISSAYSQKISGVVRDRSTQSTLPGSSVHWLGTTQGIATDAEGKFTLTMPTSDIHTLVVSFVGYRTDTILITNQSYIEIALDPIMQLNEVVVRAGSTYISRLEPIKTETITAKALEKAACCNLSESFETNASVSVSYTDAVTGAKQIQMLGLSGTYVQINSENIPSIRGLATTYGLSYIPGTWIASIDVGKGAGSVVNGYESITGQLNVELQKPENSERLFLNTYVNDMGRGEINLNLSQKIGKPNKEGKGWSTGLLLHASRMSDLISSKMDRNKDGFLDLPMTTQYNVINRWKYSGNKLQAQFGVKALYEDRQGGQVDYKHNKSAMTTMPVDTAGHGGEHGGEHGGGTLPTKTSPAHYGTGTTTKRFEAFSKLGFLFPHTPYKGLGLIISAVSHDQESFFGLTKLNGTQKTLYANLIYQSIINTTNHSFKTGVSYLLDDYKELYGVAPGGAISHPDSTFTRTESVPGVWGEYMFTIPDKFTLVAGARTDFHNLYGPIFTPRLHLKYDLTASTIVRASAGSGFRVANPLAENISVLASSRKLIVPEKLQPEKAWNYGVNLTHDFFAFDKKGTLGIDLYRTDFVNQVVVDMETPGQVAFYNLKGKSYANNLQVEMNYQPAKALDVKVAYKLYDVKTTIGDQLREKQFISRDRVLLNIAYATKFDKWKFDFTTQWNGAKRIPSNEYDPASRKNDVKTPSYFVLNAQITKAFRKWDLYLGGENLTGFTQKNPIIATNNPFGAQFDASQVWGPIYGRMLYMGLRYKIK